MSLHLHSCFVSIARVIVEIEALHGAILDGTLAEGDCLTNVTHKM